MKEILEVCHLEPHTPIQKLFWVIGHGGSGPLQLTIPILPLVAWSLYQRRNTLKVLKIKSQWDKILTTALSLYPLATFLYMKVVIDWSLHSYFSSGFPIEYIHSPIIIFLYGAKEQLIYIVPIVPIVGYILFLNYSFRDDDSITKA